MSYVSVKFTDFKYGWDLAGQTFAHVKNFAPKENKREKKDINCFEENEIKDCNKCYDWFYYS